MSIDKGEKSTAKNILDALKEGRTVVKFDASKKLRVGIIGRCSFKEKLSDSPPCRLTKKEAVALCANSGHETAPERRSLLSPRSACVLSKIQKSKIYFTKRLII